MPSIVPGIPSAPGSPYATDAELAAHEADTSTHGIADTSDLMVDGSAFADVSLADDVDPTGVNECAAALQTAITAAAVAGHRVYAKGTFKIGSTITITSNADLGDATFSYVGAGGTALRIGSSTSGDEVEWVTVVAPVVLAADKVVGEGWDDDLVGTVGVDIANLYSSAVHLPRVNGFETGVRLYGTGTGCVYNTIQLGHLDNNKVNLLLDANGTGWCNENLFLGGRFAQESAEGTDLSGVRHIVTAVCTNPVNNNLWVKPSVEGNVPEFHVSIGGSYNRIIGGRWEASTPKVQWNSDSASNLIDGGYNAGSITETWVSGAAGSNDLRGHLRHYHSKSGGTSGTNILENVSSSAYPANTIMAAGARAAAASPVTAYAVHQGATYTRMKRNTDTYDRLILDHSNARLYFGNNSAAPTAYIGSLGATAIGVVAGTFHASPDNTHDWGSGSLRPRDVIMGRNCVIGGALDHDGSTVGFYGTTPASKPTGVAVTAEGIHAALVTLGLIGA